MRTPDRLPAVVASRVPHRPLQVFSGGRQRFGLFRQRPGIYCAKGDMLPQEHVLEYLIFELGACVQPPG